MKVGRAPPHVRMAATTPWTAWTELLEAWVRRCWSCDPRGGKAHGVPTGFKHKQPRSYTVGDITTSTFTAPSMSAKIMYELLSTKMLASCFVRVFEVTTFSYPAVVHSSGEEEICVVVRIVACHHPSTGGLHERHHNAVRDKEDAADARFALASVITGQGDAIEARTFEWEKQMDPTRHPVKELKKAVATVVSRQILRPCDGKTVPVTCAMDGSTITLTLYEVSQFTDAMFKRVQAMLLETPGVLSADIDVLFTEQVCVISVRVNEYEYGRAVATKTSERHEIKPIFAPPAKPQAQPVDDDAMDTGPASPPRRNKRRRTEDDAALPTGKRRRTEPEPVHDRVLAHPAVSALRSAAATHRGLPSRPAYEQ